MITADDIARIDAEVGATVEDAVRFALESPEPLLESLYDHVYAEPGVEDA